MTIKQWQTVCAHLDAAKIELDAAFTLLMDNDEMKAALQVNDLGIVGLRYMCTPQSEWLGGDSSDSKNFTYRQPHISSKPRHAVE